MWSGWSKTWIWFSWSPVWWRYLLLGEYPSAPSHTPVLLRGVWITWLVLTSGLWVQVLCVTSTRKPLHSKPVCGSFPIPALFTLVCDWGLSSHVEMAAWGWAKNCNTGEIPIHTGHNPVIDVRRRWVRCELCLAQVHLQNRNKGESKIPWSLKSKMFPVWYYFLNLPADIQLDQA